MFNQNQLQAVEETTPKKTFTPEASESLETPPEPSAKEESAENAEIYYMPDTYRKNNVVAGKQTNIPGVWVLIITVTLLFLLGGGLVVYWLQPSFLNRIFGGEVPQAVEIPNDLVNPNSEPVSSSLPEEPVTNSQGSPKEIYLTFQRELAGANALDLYIDVYSKYATKEKYSLLLAEKTRLEDSGLSTADIFTRLRNLGSPILDGTEDITEVASETEATLEIVKTNNRETGTVVFVLEDGSWKISEEQWRSDEVSEVSGEIQIASDTDKDGLTDKEEIVLGTNVNLVDSDGDGYNDLVETNNGYNPAGEGKLEKNSNLATYINSTFNVSLLYPVSWKQKTSSTEDSIIFTSPEQQFIQLLIQPNTDRVDIASWYKKTFDVETIPTTQLFTNNNWDSVRTPDGLTAYITNKDKSYIFIVTYNIGTTRVLYYKNILDLMLRNFMFRT